MVGFMQYLLTVIFWQFYDYAVKKYPKKFGVSAGYEFQPHSIVVRGLITWSDSRLAREFVL